MTTLLERPGSRTPPSPAPGRVRRRVPVDYYLVPALLLVVLGVQGWHITGYPVISDDEGTYLAQAWAVQHGLGLAHYTYWYDHPPAAWLQLATLSWLPAALLPDQLAVAAGRLVMLAVTAVSATLVYVLARRLSFRRWASALAVLLFALSPLAVTLHRQIYLDNFAVSWMLAALVLALSPRRHLWHHTAAGVCAAVAVLSKETMAIALPALLVALWRGTHPSTRKFSLAGFCCGLMLTSGFYPLYATLKGELLPGEGHVSLVGAWLFQLAGRQGSGSVFVPGTDAREVVNSWLFYDPLLLAAGVVATLVGLAVRRLRIPAVGGLSLTLMVLRPDGYLPAMYVIQMIPFFALTLAGLVEVAATALLPAGAGARERLVRRGAVAAGLLLVVAVVAPRWYAGDRRALTSSVNDPYAAAVGWIGDHVPDPENRRIVVDDALWLDMVEAGFRPGLGAIWFYKLDLDSAVRQALPHGWRGIDYVVSTPILRHERAQLPTVDALLTHSRVLATFGTGEDRVEVRQVVPAR